MCFVYGLEIYVVGVKLLGIDIFFGYLFRFLSCLGKEILDVFLFLLVVYIRLKYYFVVLGVD